MSPDGQRMDGSGQAAEGALSEARGDGLRLSVLLANLPGMAYRSRTDRARTLEFASEGCLGLTGYGPPELTGDARLRYGDLVALDDRDAVWASVQHALAHGGPYQVRYRITARDGTVKWVWEQGRGVYSGSGKLLALEGLVIDVTPQTQGEAGIARRDRILGAVSRAAAALLGSPDWDAGLNRLLEHVGTAIGATRAFLFLNETGADGRLSARIRHEWCATGAVPELGNPDLQGGPYTEYLGRWVNLLGAGIVICGDTRDFPAEEQVPLLSLGIRSLLVVPVFAGGAWVGFVGLDDCECEREWPASDLEAMRTVATLIGAAIQRRTTEQALRDSERWYRLLAENVSDVIWTLDAETLASTYVSPSIARLRGYSAEEIAGRSMAERAHSAELAGVLGAFRERARRLEAGDESARVESYTVRQPTKDGGSVVVEMATTLVTDESGKAIEVLGVSRDVTERVRTEERLRQSEETHRALIENLPDLVVRIGLDGRPIYASPSVQRVTRTPPERIVGRTWEEMGADEALATRLRAGVEAVLVSGQAGQHEVAVDLGPEGVHTFDWRLIPEHGPRGEIRSVLTIARDITEVKQAQENQRLAAIGQLAAGVAHDFNNLLAAMSIAEEMAGASGSAADYRQLGETVRTATLRGAELCRNLMAFARPSPPSCRAERLEAVIDGALRLIERQTEVVGVRVRRRYAPDARPILLDPGQLERVLLNLLINACHAMPDGGTLTVTTSYTEGAEPTARIAVTDTGTGIAPENLARVFEPFFTTKGRLGQSETPGAGLGLSVSRGIVQAHGGTLEARSEPGHCSSFEVRLQDVRPEPATRPVESTPAPADDSTAVLGGRTVLVADDEESIVLGVAKALGSAGMAVLTAAGTAEAVEALQAQRVDLVLTDLMMPGGGAHEILRSAAALPHPPPVVVMTGRIEQTVADELSAAGAAECLTKPFRRKELLRAMAEALSGR